MTFFTSKDDDDVNCRWDECNDPKCMGAGKAHYHKTVIWSCASQKTTLDAWLSVQDKADSDAGNVPKLSVAEVDSLKPKAVPYPRWTYKTKGLGRVKRFRVHTNWRADPYTK